MMWSVIETQVEYNHWIVSNGDTKTYKDIFIWKKHRVHEFYIFHEHNGDNLIDTIFGKEYGDSKDASPVLLACRRVVYQMQVLNDKRSFSNYMMDLLYMINRDPIENDTEKLEELRLGLIKILNV